jgi:DNA-binding MarR family transcriptional regulator
LRTLERAGLLEHYVGETRRESEYYLTQAGQELLPVIERLGEWGQRWVNADVEPNDIDPGLLMWDMRRRIHLDRLPSRRVVVQFDFRGARNESWWLILDATAIEICRTDPGYDVALLVTADTLALHQTWIGRLSVADALQRGLIQLDGPLELVRAFPTWLALGSFAGIPAASSAR